MKNQLLLVLLVCCTAGLMQAQRLDDLVLNHTHLQLPTHPLQGNFKTYSVVIKPNGVNFAKMGMAESTLKETYFPLQRYQYVPDGGDFVILVTLDGNFLVSKTLKKSEVTEGQGPSAKKVTYHSYEVKTRLPVTYAIYDGERKLMLEQIYSPYDRILTNSFGKETTVAALDKAWENSGQATLDGWVKADFVQVMQGLYEHLKSRFDTYPVTRKVALYTLKNAEKIGYQEVADAVTAAKPVVEGATANKRLTLADFGDNVGRWEKILAEVDPKDKKLDVVFQMAAYNLGMANALSGQYETAVKLADRISEAGRKDLMVKAIKDIVADRQAREKANENVPTTFSGTVNPTAHQQFMAEFKSVAQEAVAERAASVPDFVILYPTKDTLLGVVTYEYKKVGDTRTFQGAWVENADPNTGLVKKRWVKMEEILMLRKNQTLYIPVTMSIAIISITTLQEPLYEKGSLTLTRINDGEQAGYFYLLHITKNKKGESKLEVYALNDGLAFLNLNKGIANKFETCPVVAQKAGKGYYQRNETSLRELMDDYSTCGEQ